MVDDLLTDTKPEAFLDGIAEEHHSAVSGFGNKGELAKGYASLFQKMGTSVQIPNEDTPADEISAFYNKLGRPDTKDGYEIERPEKLPEGMNYDEKFEMTMRGIAHEAGITQPQMKTLVKAFNEYQIATFGEYTNELNRTREEGERALKEKWADNYDANLQVAQRALKELVPGEDGEAFVKLIEDSKLGNNPVFVRAFHEIGKKMLDDTFIKGGELPEDKGYKPAYPDSPEMYSTGDDDESKKARAYFEAKGHTY